MPSIAKEIKAVDISAASHVQQATPDKSMATLIGAATDGVKIGSKMMLQSELSEAEQLANQEIGAALQEDYTVEATDANARSIQVFQNELKRANAIGVAKEQADIRSKTILKKWSNRLPGLSGDFQRVAAGIAGTGSDSQVIQSSAAQQQKLLTAQIESLKAASGKHGLIFSTDPVLLGELYARMDLDSRRKRIEDEAAIRKQTGEYNKETQLLHMPNVAFSIASSLPGTMKEVVGVDITNPSAIANLQTNVGDRQLAVARMDETLVMLKGKMRADYPNISVSEFDASFRVIQDRFDILKGVVDGTRSVKDYENFNNIFKAGVMSKVYASDIGPAVAIVADVPGLSGNLSLQSKIGEGSLDLLERLTSDRKPAFGPPKKNATPEQIKEESKAIVSGAAAIAKKIVSMPPELLDSEVGKAMQFSVSKVLSELGSGRDAPASAYVGLFEAALRDPETWKVFTTTVDPTSLPAYSKAIETFLGQKLTPAINKAVGALKDRPFFGESDAELVQYEIRGNTLTFVPQNPRDAAHVQKAKEFNAKYGKPLNIAIQAAVNIIGPDAAKASLESAALDFRLNEANVEGERSGLLAGSQQRRISVQQARGIAEKYKGKSVTLEVLLEKESTYPALIDNEEWQSVKDDAVKNGRIGNVKNVQEVMKLLQQDTAEGTPAPETKPDELSSLTKEFQEIKKLDNTATFEMFLDYKREQTA